MPMMVSSLLPQKQAKNAREKAAGAQKDLLLHRYRSGRVAPGYHSSCRPHSRSTLIVDPASQAGQFLLLKQPTGFIDCWEEAKALINIQTQPTTHIGHESIYLKEISSFAYDDVLRTEQCQREYMIQSSIREWTIKPYYYLHQSCKKIKTHRHDRLWTSLSIMWSLVVALAQHIFYFDA